jgi:uncharacterized membrane protein
MDKLNEIKKEEKKKKKIIPNRGIEPRAAGIISGTLWTRVFGWFYE